MKKCLIGLCMVGVLVLTSATAMAGTALIPFWRAHAGTVNLGSTLVAVTNIDSASQVITITLYNTGYGEAVPATGNEYASTNNTVAAGATWLVDTAQGVVTANWTTAAGGYTTTVMGFGSGTVVCATADKCKAVSLAYLWANGVTGFSFTLTDDVDGATLF